MYRNDKTRPKFHSIVGMIKYGCRDCASEKELTVFCLLPSYSAKKKNVLALSVGNLKKTACQEIKFVWRKQIIKTGNL